MAAATPFAFVRSYREVRRVRTGGFPYHVYYLVHRSQIVWPPRTSGGIRESLPRWCRAAFSMRKQSNQRRLQRERIDAKLLAALDSGNPIEMTPEWWEERRRKLAKQTKQRPDKA